MSLDFQNSLVYTNGMTNLIKQKVKEMMGNPPTWPIYSWDYPRGVTMRVCNDCYNAFEGDKCPYCKCSKLEQQNAAMLEALKAVEWVWDGSIQYCAWCKQGKILGHADNCHRQQAIALVEGDEDGV